MGSIWTVNNKVKHVLFLKTKVIFKKNVSTLVLLFHYSVLDIGIRPIQHRKKINL